MILLQDIGSTVTVACFRSEIPCLIKTQGLSIKVCCLQCVADNKFNVVYPFDRKIGRVGNAQYHVPPPQIQFPSNSYSQPKNCNRDASRIWIGFSDPASVSD